MRDKKAIKSGVGRPKVPCLSDYAIKILSEFVIRMGGQRAISKKLGVSNALVWCWLNKKSRPTWQYAKKIEELSEGELNQEMLYLTDEDLISAPAHLKDYVFDIFIAPKAHLVDLSKDEYYKNFVPYHIRKIIDSNCIADHEVQFLVAFFGKSFTFWRTAMLLYPSKARCLYERVS